MIFNNHPHLPISVTEDSEGVLKLSPTTNGLFQLPGLFRHRGHCSSRKLLEPRFAEFSNGGTSSIYHFGYRLTSWTAGTRSDAFYTGRICVGLPFGTSSCAPCTSMADTSMRQRKAGTFRSLTIVRPTVHPDPHSIVSTTSVHTCTRTLQSHWPRTMTSPQMRRSPGGRFCKPKDPRHLCWGSEFSVLGHIVKTSPNFHQPPCIREKHCSPHRGTTKLLGERTCTTRLRRAKRPTAFESPTWMLTLVSCLVWQTAKLCQCGGWDTHPRHSCLIITNTGICRTEKAVPPASRPSGAFGLQIGEVS